MTSVPLGIDCPSTACSALSDENETVTLTPTPGGDSLFDGWSGDPDCADGVVITTADVSCTATFMLAADLIFADGFESGNLDGWSSVAP